MKGKQTLVDVIYEMALRVNLLKLRLTGDRPTGLSLNEELFLEILGKAGTERVSIIAHKLKGLSPSMVSVIVKNLSETKDFIKKEDDPTDKRQTLVTLTNKGEAALSEIRDRKIRLYTAIKTALDTTEKEEDVLRDLFGKAIEYFDDKLLSDRIESKF